MHKAHDSNTLYYKEKIIEIDGTSSQLPEGRLIREEAEAEGMETPKNQKLRLPVDKLKAERKNTWGPGGGSTTRNKGHYSNRTGKVNLQNTQLSCVKTDGENELLSDDISN